MRAAALRTCTSLASTPASLHLPTSSLLALLPFAVTTPTSVELHVDPSTFFEEQEEVVRRELVLFLTATYRRMLGQEKEKKDGKEKVEKELVEDFLVFVMAREQDWEVKVLAAAFWKLLVEEELLEEERVLVGLVLGCTDYEASVRAEFRRVVGEARRRGHLATRKVEVLGKRSGEGGEGVVEHKVRRVAVENIEVVEENNGAREANIENILDEPLKNLITDLRTKVEAGQGGKEPCDLMGGWRLGLPRVSRGDFQAWVQELQEEEEEGGREGREGALVEVLEDIVHSSSDSGMIDLVDCY